MVFDWKNDKELALANGFENRNYLPESMAITAVKEIFEDCTFRNFPNLDADGIQFYNCIFEDCGHISLDSSETYDCTFRRIDDFYLLRSKIRKSHFYELKSDSDTFCDSDSPIFMEDSKISLCTFDDVELRNDAWLCDAVGDCLVEHCTFTNCRTEREDLKLFHCEETVGKIVKKQREVFMVDEDTCKGLDRVTNLDGAITSGSVSPDD